MTLALGMLCKEALVIAADTQITWSDGRTEHGIKVHLVICNSGSYALTCACVDSDAANTLISAIQRDLRLIDPKSLIGMESVITDSMKAWYESSRSGEDRPYIQLVVGASINSNPSIEDDELGLYFCEPPNTVSRKTMEDGKGYIGVGEGNAVIKSTFCTLFSDLPSPRVCLNRLSYLMYKAKKDCASSVGGDTDAVVLWRGQIQPQWVNRLDMAQAESLGRLIDNALSRVASAIISETYLADREVLNLAGDIQTKGLAYKNSLQFHSRTGEEIL